MLISLNLSRIKSIATASLSAPDLSCFTRPLSDFGYPPVVVTDHKKEEVMVEATELKVFPNPVMDELNVQIYCQGKESLQIIISDLTGSIVYRENINFNCGTLQIPIQYLSNGIYLIKLSERNGNFVMNKFVKQ